ncbi:MAG: hypothetical protein DHS20C18_07390 [Saprospiraceae bacterium]|nr:MAG: hypothetical protein DHS20C18_07390 [Saprospiraceae bacterium]
MKTWISKAAFLLFSTFVAFILGLFVGGWQVPKASGLAGGAIVLGYGVMGLVIGLILAIILVRRLSSQHRVYGNLILGALTLTGLIWIGYRYQIRNQRRALTKEEWQKKPEAPDASNDSTHQIKALPNSGN